MRARAAATFTAASLFSRSNQAAYGLRPPASRYSRTSIMLNGNTYGTIVQIRNGDLWRDVLYTDELRAPCRSLLRSPCLPRAVALHFARLPRQAHEQTFRPGARHAGPAAAENPRA